MPKQIPEYRRRELENAIKSFLILGTYAEVRDDGSITIDGEVLPQKVAMLGQTLLDVAAASGET